jgi:Trp operon repressor
MVVDLLMTDPELEALIARLNASPELIKKQAAAGLRQLKDQRDELQGVADAIAMGRA